MVDGALSVFVYQYGDADNVSKPGRLLLTGVYDPELEEVIRTACDSREYFVAEQLGVPVLYADLYALSGGPTIDDIAFHEFISLRPATQEEAHSLSVWSGLVSFVDRFRDVKYWDCTLSPHCP